MNATASNLNIFDAIKYSLSFCLEFLKKYWLVSIFYLLNLLWFMWMMLEFNQDAHVYDHPDPTVLLSTLLQAKYIGSYIFFIISSMIIGYIMIYYGIRLATSNLDSFVVSPNKTFITALWQLFCMHIVLTVVSLPLLLLLILPFIWWCVKTSAASANLLCSDDGPIESIKKSFQLTKDRFWISLGYWLGVIVLTTIGLGIIFGIVGLALIVPALLSGHFDTLQHDRTIEMAQAFIKSISTLLQCLIFYGCQGWFFVYLKNKQNEAGTGG